MASTASADDAERAMARMLGEDPSSGSDLFAGADNIRVAARIRPMTPKEIIADPRVAVAPGAAPNSVRCTVGESEHDFRFDRVFPSYVGQDAIFDQIGAPMVDAVMSGINGAVIAYGQTGSGKTFTMEGGEGADEGIVPRMFRLLFEQLRRSGAESDVRCSCVEIYNERIFDLINFSRTSVDVWSDEARGLVLTGASEVPVLSGGAALRLFRQAVTNRKTYETAMNATSSRSHCVFLLTVGKRLPGEAAATCSQLYLVDLAGSERVSKTHVDGERLGEAKHINRSLLALGKVISALSGAAADSDHVPYRDSQLTRLLQNSLGGNSRTVLAVTLSPSAWNAGESLGTLRFGDMSRRIQNTAVKNTVVGEAALSDMIALAREHRARNEVLLARYADQAAQFAELFEELGVARGDIDALAGGGVDRANEAAGAPPEAEDDDDDDEDLARSAPILAATASAVTSVV